VLMVVCEVLIVVLRVLVKVLIGLKLLFVLYELED